MVLYFIIFNDNIIVQSQTPFWAEPIIVDKPYRGQCQPLSFPILLEALTDLGMAYYHPQRMVNLKLGWVALFLTKNVEAEEGNNV